MERIEGVKLVLYIETNKQTIQEEYETLLDLVEAYNHYLDKSYILQTLEDLDEEKES